MGVIRFNGISSADFGCTIERRPNHTRGSRRGELIEVPGRNGAAVLEDGSFTTYKQEYVMAFKEGDTMPPYKRAAQVAEWLLGSRGFCRLEDDFEPNVYRMARYAGALNIEQVADKYGQVVLEFECQPQRFLKSGESEIIVDSKSESNDEFIGTLTVQPIPYGAVAAYIESQDESVQFSGYYEDKNGDTVGQAITENPVTIPNGAVRMVCEWSNATADTGIVMGVTDADGNQTPLCGVSGTSPTVYNPTDFEARPLLKFVDTSVEPTPIGQTFSKTFRTGIGNGGVIVPAGPMNYTSSEVNTTGYAYAIVTGLGYSFFDSSDRCVSYYNSAPIQGLKVVIPTNASKIIVGGSESYEAELKLQAARPNPGASAVTINGITISLDFSVHDTIYLDCDLHDAYYIDGSSANNKVTFTSTIEPYPTFPGFLPGESTVIVRDGANLDFSIVPRWWSL